MTGLATPVTHLQATKRGATNPTPLVFSNTEIFKAASTDFPFYRKFGAAVPFFFPTQKKPREKPGPQNPHYTHTVDFSLSKDLAPRSGDVSPSPV